MAGEKAKGAFFGIMSAVCYGMNPLFGLPLYRMGFTTPSVLFYRFLFATVMLCALMAVGKKSCRLSGNHIIPAIGAGVILALSCLTLFQSFRYMDSGIAATVLFVYPAMVAVIMRVCFKEKLTWFTGGCIAAALAGVILLSGNGSGNVSWRGMVYSLLSALTYAIYIVLLRKSSLRTLAPETVTLYALIIGLPLFFIQTKCGVDLNLLTHWQEWGCTVGLALFTAFFSFLFMAKAVKYIGATETAVMGALEPITALLVGVIVFGEKLTVTMCAGVVLVIAAVVAIICRRD